MKGFKTLALAVALCVAAPMTESAAKPPKSSWADECGKKDSDKDKESCCSNKMIDCELGCVDHDCHGLPDCMGPQIECRKKCKSRWRQCKRDVASLRFPYGSTSSRYQTGKSGGSRICCKRGRRSWLATARDCRRRGGRTVHGRFCKNTTARSVRRDARICCKTRRGHVLLSSRRCRARRGRQVHLKWCRKTSRPEHRRQRHPR